MAIKHLPWKDPPKFTQIVIFWFENILSGNPARPRFIVTTAARQLPTTNARTSCAALATA
jgi:hypothetical protein